MKDTEKRVRRWHDDRASDGLGPTYLAIQERNVARWWDVHTLIEELDDSRTEVDRLKKINQVLETQHGQTQDALRQLLDTYDDGDSHGDKIAILERIRDLLED